MPSRQAEFLEREPLPAARPRAPQNSGQVEPRRSCWQWKTGLVSGPRGEPCQLWEQVPSSAFRTYLNTNPHGTMHVTSSGWQTHTA